MIKINLLPPELRPRKKTTLPLGAMSLIGGAIILILIAGYAAIGIKITGENRKLQSIKKEYEEIRPEYERVMKLKGDKEKLEAKIALMEKLIVQRLLWAKKLNQLSDLMPPRVWLSSLSVMTTPVVKIVEGKETHVPVQTLVIRGKTYSDKGEKMVEQVGDFMRRIKKHEPFFKDFLNVELVSTERENIADTEVMRFELTCQFK